MFFLEYTLNTDEYGKVTLFLNDDDASVYRITTSNSKFKTKRGAHVVMSLNELIKLYPNYNFSVAWDLGEDYYVFILPKLEGSFVFDGKDIRAQCGSKHPDCEYLMGSLKSKSFFAY